MGHECCGVPFATTQAVAVAHFMPSTVALGPLSQDTVPTVDVEREPASHDDQQPQHDVDAGRAGSGLGPHGECPGTTLHVLSMHAAHILSIC